MLNTMLKLPTFIITFLSAFVCWRVGELKAELMDDYVNALGNVKRVFWRRFGGGVTDLFFRSLVCYFVDSGLSRFYDMNASSDLYLFMVFCMASRLVACYVLLRWIRDLNYAHRITRF